MNQEQWKEHLHLTAVEMLKWGEPCEVSDTLSLTFEDGRELTLDLLQNGTVVCRGILKREFEPSSMTEPLALGLASKTPFELARTISLKVLPPYTEEVNAEKASEEKKDVISSLHAHKAHEIADHLYPIAARVETKKEFCMVDGEAFAVQVSDTGFIVRVVSDVKVETVAKALKMLLHGEE